MNLILLEAEPEAQRFSLHGENALHVSQVLRAKIGDHLRVGVLGLGRGEVEVLSFDNERVEVRLLEPGWVDSQKFEALPVLILALPRPKVFRRMLRQAVVLGYKEIHFCHSYRVEKSYWQSPLLLKENVKKEVFAGLSLAEDYFEPQIFFHRLFKPFIEDHAAQWVKAKGHAIVAHPEGPSSEPGSPRPELLALGPEGGWIQYELDLMERLGFARRSFSTRTLACETALPFITGALLA